MLVKCERCGAGYEFPVDQLPPDGLRAKCAACGHVMYARGAGAGDEADFDDVEMSVDISMNAPPQVAPSRVVQPIKPGRIGRALGTAPPVSGPPPAVTPPLGVTPSAGLPTPPPTKPGAANSTPPPEFGPPPPEPPPEATPAPPGQVPPMVVNVDRDAVVRRDDAQASVGFRIDPEDRARRREQAEQAEQAQLPSEPTEGNEIAPPTPEPAPSSPEPSMVVDLDHLGEDAPEPQPAPPEPEPDQVQAFAPLASTSSLPSTPKPAMREAATMLVAAQHELPDPGDIKPVRPPSIFSLVLLVFLLTAGGFLAFVSWSNGWRPVWEEPELSLRVAFGLAERKVPKPPRPPKMVETEPMRGKLEVAEVAVEVVKVNRSQRVAVVQGRLVNKSNRRHARIQLEATLSNAATPLKTRRFACCSAVPTAQATANTKDAPAAPPADASIEPAQSQPFTVVFHDVDRRVDLSKAQASVTVTYSEPEHPNR